MEGVSIGTPLAEGTRAFFAPPPPEPHPYDEITPKLTPFVHQRDAVKAAVENLEKYGCHALLMEMATGKTKTTIDTFMVMRSRGRMTAMIIVAPKTVMSTWTDDELPKHMTIPYLVNTWDGRKSKKAMKEADDMIADDSGAAKILLVNTESFQSGPDEMKRRFKALAEKEKTLLVVDESSYIKSPDAARSRALVGAGKLCAGRMILTGTDIENSPLDLYMPFNFLMPGFWNVRNFFLFRARYAILKDAYGSGGRTHKEVIAYQRLPELLERVKPFSTRVLKKDCLDLPPKIRVTIHVELSEKQRVVYDSLKKHLAAMVENERGDASVVTVPNKVALFTKFRQITGGTLKGEDGRYIIDDSPPKLERLIDDVSDSDEQAIIWCCFNEEIRLVTAALLKIGTAAPYCGDTPHDKREEYKKAFQEGKIRFLVMNSAEGSYGLNLQCCHIQYIYTRHLSPGKVWQGEDRIHRPGQDSPCVYKSLVARGTVDERVEELLDRKTELRDLFRSGAVPETIVLDGNDELLDASRMTLEEMLHSV